MLQYLAAACLLLIFFLLGATLDLWLFRRYSLTFSVLAGFMVLNAAFFVFTYAFRAIGLKFSLLVTVFSAFLIFTLLFSAYRFIKCLAWKNYWQSVTGYFREHGVLKICLILFIAVILLLSFTLSMKENPDSDDSMYMAKAMEIIKTDTLHFHESRMWLGWECDFMTDATDSSTLETLYAYLSLISGIPVAVFCRKVMVLVITAVVCCTVFNLGISLFRGKQEKIKALLMLAGYLFLCVVYNAVFDSVPYRQIMSPWHGKTILAAIVFPCIMSVCVDIYSHADEIKWAEWIYLAIVVTASISASIIGVNFTVIYCIVMAAPLLIYRLIAKKTVKQFFFPAIVAMLPSILFSGIALITVITSNSGYFTRFASPDWYHSFYRTFIADSKGIVLILFLAAMVYFLIKGSVEQRLILVGTTVFLFATFLNPWLVKPVAKYITTGSIYWRLYWVIPIWTAIPAAAADALVKMGIDKAKIFLRGAIIALISMEIMLFSFAGSSMFTYTVEFLRCWYPPRYNSYALPEMTIACADAILEDSDEDLPMLLDVTDRELWSVPMFIRQYTADIGLCVGIRENQVGLRTDIISGENISVSDFVSKCSEADELLEVDMLENAIKHLEADYLFAPDCIIPQNDFLQLMVPCGDNSLYRINIDQ